MISADKVPQDKKLDEKSSVDLLGLNVQASAASDKSSEDEAFDAFVSAPVVSNSTNDTSTEKKTENNPTDEEADFFNQKAPEEKKVMSKESILSLYGSSTPQNSQVPLPFGGSQPFGNLGQFNNFAAVQGATVPGLPQTQTAPSQTAGFAYASNGLAPNLGVSASVQMPQVLNQVFYSFVCNRASFFATL